MGNKCMNGPFSSELGPSSSRAYLAPFHVGQQCHGHPGCPRAGLLAKKAVAAGLRVQPYIRTSLAPGSGMVTHYLSSSGVLPYLRRLG